MPEGIYIPGLALQNLILSGKDIYTWAPGERDRWLDQRVYVESASGNDVFHLATDNTVRFVCGAGYYVRATFLANVLNKYTACSDMPVRERD